MTEGPQPTRTFGDAPNPGGPQHDPALEPPRPEELAAASPLEMLRATVSKEVHRPAIHLPVPERDGVVIEYDPNIDNDLLTAWRERSMYEDQRRGTDPLKLGALVLANKCVSFSIHGRKVTEGGQPLTFADQAVWDMVHAASSLEAVRKLYGVDAHVIIAGEEVLRAAGYGDVIRQAESDPTVAPLSR